MVSKEEHERERRAFWGDLCIALLTSEKAFRVNPDDVFPAVIETCNQALAERDKRFPAPEESGEK